MDTYILSTFTNDANVTIKVPTNYYYNDLKTQYSAIFNKRNDHEVMFRRIITFLIKNNIINGNIIDLGAWIGDNSIPWAMNINKENIVYAIDPSPNNIAFIKGTCTMNNINNIRALQTAISDKNEIIYTNNGVNHASFSSHIVGKTMVNAVSLDYLEQIGVIDDIGFIHLDVEGFEANVINGSRHLITTFRPIIAFEQHITEDDYNKLSSHLESLNYTVYLINEILPGCNKDCRNLIAFPNERDIDVGSINRFLESPILLLLTKSCSEAVTITGTVYGTSMSGNIFRDVKGFKHLTKDLTLFPVHDSYYTKIIAINTERKWIEGRYMLGHVNILTSYNVSLAFDSAQGVETNRSAYNIDVL